MALKLCTLVGADEATPLFELAVISDTFPFVEWGFLYSPRRQGAPGRYPSTARIRRALMELPRYTRTALHVCGEGVTDLLAGEQVVTDLVDLLGARGGHIQFNLNGVAVEHWLLREYIASKSHLQFITQHNEQTSELTRILAGMPNHSIVFDSSQGHGVLPASWPKPFAGTYCGYAGGLGPETIEKALPKIYLCAGQEDFWISMCGKLRDMNDRFDVRAARNCLELISFDLIDRRELPKLHPRKRQCELIDLFDAGLTRENESGVQFEVMLQRLVHATEHTLDPNVQEIRRKAENLLLRNGNVSLLRKGEPVPEVPASQRKPH